MISRTQLLAASLLYCIALTSAPASVHGAIVESSPLAIEKSTKTFQAEVSGHQYAIETALTVTNSGGGPRYLLLVSPNALVQLTKVVMTQPDGIEVPLRRLDLQTDQLVYELNIKSGETLISIRQSDIGSFLPDWSVSEPGPAIKKLFAEQLMLTVGITIILILAVYQLGIYVISRDPGYLNLFAMLSTMGLFIFAHSGWGGTQFGWERITVLQFFFVTTAAGLHFGSSFLDLKRTAPLSGTLANVLCLLSLGTAVCFFFTSNPAVLEFLLLAVVGGFILLQIQAFRLAWRGETRAKFYLAGISLLCIAAVWAITSYLRVGYTTPIDTWVLLAAICVSCLVWCVSYAQKLKEFQDEQILNREHLLQAQRSETEAIKRYHVATAESEAASEFLATMSHEIRTPMNGVLGMAEALQDSELNPTQQKHLNILTRSGRLLMVVLNDILDYSKYSSGNIDLDEQETDVIELLDDSVAVLRQRASEKGLDLFIYPGSTLPTSIYIDRERILQVLFNLISNAIKFTDKGTITLSAEFAIDTQELKLNVVDTGIGISQEIQPRLFARFTQAESGIRRQYGGTGLGLAIVKLLVESMGGSVGIDSKPELGSRFWANIPITKHKSEPPLDTNTLSIRSGNKQLLKQSRMFFEWREQSVIEDHDDSEGIHVLVSNQANYFTPPVTFNELNSILGHKKRAGPDLRNTTLSLKANLLVAEDNKVNQMVIQRLLENKFDCTYTLVEDGQAAIEAYEAKNGSFDCILMDCEMPGVDGYAAAIAIRALEASNKLPKVPIIALTAHVVESYRTRAIEAGMTDFVTKPINHATLKSSLVAAITKLEGQFT
tara:strand:+ start:282 stop:2777 length:2496 start_codon:yes stop_codon:yes gene_type:complete